MTKINKVPLSQLKRGYSDASLAHVKYRLGQDNWSDIGEVHYHGAIDLQRTINVVILNRCNTQEAAMELDNQKCEVTVYQKNVYSTFAFTTLLEYYLLPKASDNQPA